MNKKIYARIKKNKTAMRIIRKVRSQFDNPYNTDGVYEVRPMQYYALGHSMQAYRLNLLIPSVNQRDVYGGIATALTFFEDLCDHLECNARIIVFDATIEDDRVSLRKDYKLVNEGFESEDDRQIIDMSVRDQKKLPVGDKDIFLATGWWTAYIIYPIIKWQISTMGKKEQYPLIYFIQDYEPGFYPWSSRYLMAESTYRFQDIRVLAAFNSKYLMDYFLNHGYQFHRMWYFDPVFNAGLEQYLQSHTYVERKNQILIYGRPGTPRNAFELIMESLKEWIQIQEQPEQWNIVAAGEPFPDISISDRIVVRSLGKMTIEEYAMTMLESKIGISLMVSPHPSYPPLEMAAYGMKVITNSYENKNLDDGVNIFSIHNGSAYAVANMLKQLCDQSNRGELTYVGKNYFSDGKTWEDILRDIREELSVVCFDAEL